jgi:hypothetical protein
MQTSLLAIANKAKDRKHYRFLNLYRLIGDENFLLECWSEPKFGVRRAICNLGTLTADQRGDVQSSLLPQAPPY